MEHTSYDDLKGSMTDILLFLYSETALQMFLMHGCSPLWMKSKWLPPIVQKNNLQCSINPAKCNYLAIGQYLLLNLYFLPMDLVTPSLFQNLKNFKGHLLTCNCGGNHPGWVEPASTTELTTFRIEALQARWSCASSLQTFTESFLHRVGNHDQSRP